MTFGLSELVAVLSALIAAISVYLNIRVVNRQLALQTEEVLAAVDAEKTVWLRETLDVFAEAEALVLNGAEAACREGAHKRLAARFSVLADQGRISFPNLRPGDRGQENPEAYQGVRQPAINAVILAHDLVQALPGLSQHPSEMVQELLFDCRRVLVSEVQRSVNPRRRSQALQAQSRRSKKERDVTRGDVRQIIDSLRKLDVPVSFN